MISTPFCILVLLIGIHSVVSLDTSHSVVGEVAEKFRQYYLTDAHENVLTFAADRDNIAPFMSPDIKLSVNGEIKGVEDLIVWCSKYKTCTESGRVQVGDDAIVKFEQNGEEAVSIRLQGEGQNAKIVEIALNKLSRKSKRNVVD